MCFTLFVTGSTALLEKLKIIEQQIAVVLMDPYSFLSGGIAGAAGRAAVLPVDSHGGALRCVYRRAPTFGIVFWIYPNSRGDDVASAVQAGLFAGGMSKFLCNPFNAVRDAAEADKSTYQQAIKKLHSKGWIHFWAGQPPIMANALYWGCVFGIFHATRNIAFREDFHVPTSDVMAAAIGGGVSSAIATTALFQYSKKSYNDTLNRAHIFQQPFSKVLAKEVPMMAITFGVFVALQ
eukprot:PhF_6_TR3353/c0_g1_i1/m.4754